MGVCRTDHWQSQTECFFMRSKTFTHGQWTLDRDNTGAREGHEIIPTFANGTKNQKDISKVNRDICKRFFNLPTRRNTYDMLLDNNNNYINCLKHILWSNHFLKRLNVHAH